MGKKILVCLALVSTTAIAGMPDVPPHMPNVPMPAFNFFAPRPSVLHKQGVHTAVLPVTYDSAHFVTLYPGSLKNNIVRISQAYGWKQVIWSSQDDYRWIGQIRVAANNLPDILGQILKDYPLQANFYAGNHVLVIQPRTIQT